MENIIRPFEIKELKSDENTFHFEGYVAAFGNVDSDNDLIEKGAFKNWLRDVKEKSIPAFWNHKSDTPIGILPISDMREDEPGLFVKGRLPKDDTFVTGRVIPQLRIGSVGKMSIGYITKDYEYKGSVRHLKAIDLYEGSLVALPANTNANITAFKSITTFGNLPLADRDKPWDSEAAIGRLRQWAGIGDDNDLSDPDNQRRYRQGFFWYDGYDPDLLGSYKLPFVDVMDDKLYAVPRGIFAAAAALKGARGGVMLPIDDRPGVIRNVERYYDKMGIESPFGKFFRIDDLTAIDPRTTEKLLKTGVRFSSKSAKLILSVLNSNGLRDGGSSGQRDAEIDMLLEKVNGILNQFKEGAHV